MKPCLTCGEPVAGTYCAEDEPRTWQHREGSARARGYSPSWDRLSRRARLLQPFCSDCGSTDDLQLDHTARTWERIDAGKVVRLKDTGGVVCGPCNRRRGAGRGRETHGTGTLDAPTGPRGKPQSPLLRLGSSPRHVAANRGVEAILCLAQRPLAAGLTRDHLPAEPPWQGIVRHTVELPHLIVEVLGSAKHVNEKCVDSRSSVYAFRILQSSHSVNDFIHAVFVSRRVRLNELKPSKSTLSVLHLHLLSLA